MEAKEMGNSLNIIRHYVNGICVSDSAIDIHTAISTMRRTMIEKLDKK
jgi:hypothetical protein